MEQNKTGHYLKYAVGEIFLVVIGILIALQINNWNENRKTANIAKKYILDIKNDLEDDTLTFNSAVRRLQHTIEKNKILLNPSTLSNLSKDSLFAMISTSFHSARRYKINNSTYQKLSNTGFLESGIYANFFHDVNNYYNKEYVTYSEFINWDEEQSIDIFHPDFLRNNTANIDLPTIASQRDSTNDDNGAKTSLLQLINSTEFRNKIWANYTRKEGVIGVIEFQKKSASDLLQKIDFKIIK